MSSTQVPGVPADITLLVGPLLLGYLFNWGLFGVLCLQMYIYYLSFPRDSIYIKVLVYSLFAIDCLQTAMTTHNAWHFLSRGWGDLGVLADPGWSWIAVPLFSGIVSCTVQLFFSWRIWKLSRSYVLSAVIVCVALAQGISACVSGIWFAIINDITKISSLFPSATVWLGGSALADVMITASLVAYLSRTSTGFSQTDDVVSRLIRNTVETGAVTATAATAELILFLVYKENNLHMIPALALAKLYTNTLMATLNARSEIFNSSERSRMNTMSRGLEWSGGSTGGTTLASKKRSQTSRKAEVQITTHQTTQEVAMVDLPSQTRRTDNSSFDDEKVADGGYSVSTFGQMKSYNVDVESGEQRI